MGKKSRRPSRRDRHTPVVLNGLTVTIGASPTFTAAGQLSLENELRLVRSSLLYAGHVDLIAPGAAFLWTLTPLRGLDADDACITVAGLPPETLRRMGVEGYRSARSEGSCVGSRSGHHPTLGE